jgi:uncharacterized protein YdhG (YjbR/CyaY superfamily)
VAEKPQSIDEYLSSVSDDKRGALEQLRQAIRVVVPDAEECISYGIPAFRWNGKVLVGFAAAAKHCAFYPWSSTTVGAFWDDLKDYDTSKGAIRFQPEKPLPTGLIRKLVQARIQENNDK